MASRPEISRFLFLQMFTKFKGRLVQGDVIWSLIFTGLRLGSGILVLPLALRTIPSAEMGIYYTFMSLSGLAAFLDFGMGGTIGRSAAYAWGGARSFSARGLPDLHENIEPNRDLLATLTHLTRFWYYAMALVALVLLSAVGTLFVNRRIDESGLDSSMTLCWLFFAFVTAYGIGTSFWNMLLSGIGDVKNSARYGAIAQLISTAFLAGALLCGLKVWAYAISLLIGPMIGRYLVRKRYIAVLNHPLPVVWSRPDLNVLSQLWPMTWRMGASVFGIFLMQRGNTLICSAFLGLETTAKYGLTLNLFTILLQISGVFLFVANPRIARAHVQRDVAGLRRLFIPRLYGGLALACAGAAILIGFGPEILHVIGSHTGMLPAGLSSLLFAILLLDAHQNGYMNLVMSSNENPFVFASLLSSVIMLTISTWTTQRFGLIGMILTYGAVQLAWNHWWPVVRGARLLKRPVLQHPDQKLETALQESR